MGFLSGLTGGGNLFGKALDPGDYFSGRGNAEIDRMIAAMDPGEKPTAAEWKSLLGTDGRLTTQYQLGASGPYAELLKQYRQQAYQPASEKSAYQQALEARLAEGQMQQLGAAPQAAMARAAEARAQLAGKRGLSSAAAERLAMGSQKNLNKQLQDIRAQGAMQGLGIQADELARRQGMFEKLANIERDVEGSNINAALQEVGSEREKKQQDYAQQMQTWAAGKQAQAQLAASKKSGFK